MEPLEQLFALELEFHRRLRLAPSNTDSAALHTSYALQSGYEHLLRYAGGVTFERIEQIARRATPGGDPRDVHAARDSLLGLFGLRRT